MRYVRALGLALVASLSLLALTASGAQAGENKGDWELNGQLITLTIKVNSSLYNANASSMLVPDLNFAIRCSTLNVTSGTVLPLANGRSFGHASVVFEECQMYRFDTLQLLPFCEIFEKEEGVNKGKITASALFHVVRTNAKDTAYVLIEPTGAESLNEGVFADAYFGELCWTEGLIALALGTLIAELGSLTLLGGGVSHWAQGLNGPLLREAPAGVRALFGDLLAFGSENHAFLDGEIEIFEGDANHSGTLGVEAGS